MEAFFIVLGVIFGLFLLVVFCIYNIKLIKVLTALEKFLSRR